MNCSVIEIVVRENREHGMAPSLPAFEDVLFFIYLIFSLVFKTPCQVDEPTLGPLCQLLSGMSSLYSLPFLFSVLFQILHFKFFIILFLWQLASGITSPVLKF